MPSCVNIIDANDLDLVHRAQDWAELINRDLPFLTPKLVIWRQLMETKVVSDQ